jgi:putative glutamine amidotransferase
MGCIGTFDDKKEKRTMKIALTKNTSNEEKLGKYKSWLLRFNPLIEFHELSHEQGWMDDIDGCDGLLLTGGGDVHPNSYGNNDAHVQTKETDERRDKLEFSLIDRAIAVKLPILGICRGMQSMNVHLGGTLHLDLESAGFARHTEKDGKENRHQVKIESQSFLESVAGVDSAEVNSFHHQGVDLVGKGLRVSARSEDGVIEAMEWTDPEGKPFLLLVQWHPERMKDTYNPLTEKVGRIFLEEVKKQQRTNHSNEVKTILT